MLHYFLCSFPLPDKKEARKKITALIFVGGREDGRVWFEGEVGGREGGGQMWAKRDKRP